MSRSDNLEQNCRCLMRGIAFHVFTPLWFCLYAIASSPLLLTFYGVNKLLDAHPTWWFLKFPAGALAFFWIGTFFWLLYRVKGRVIDDGEPIFAAIKESVADLRLALCLIPMIGPWFAPSPGNDRGKNSTGSDS